MLWRPLAARVASTVFASCAPPRKRRGARRDRARLEQLLFDAADLRALQPEPRHEPLLGEDEGVDVAPAGRGGEGLGLALVDDHDARAHADLEALALVEIGQRGVGHEEESVAEALHARLQTVGRRDRIVVARVLATLEQHPLAVLAAEEESRLDDVREDKNALGLCP